MLGLDAMIDAMEEYVSKLQKSLDEVEEYEVRMNNMFDNLPDEEKELIDELFFNASIEISIGIEKIVQDWYDSYSPMFYKDRREDLKDAYVAESYITEKTSSLETSWGIDSGKMPSGSNGLGPMMMDYLAFKKGYHGGANPKGVYYAAPRYRKPYPYYTYWGRPAVKTFPIDQEIEAWLETYNKGMQEEYDRRIAIILDKYGL